ncbi:dimethylarginine dimethylaminohydrolase family protein [Flaviflexus massiliensis]|uniref:dimethylarginine dimethylaminohydrolase family protein n=1 Tax=Flaviflexus massiliensis TaxID=1522309 RepID=UPI0006D52E79|nr:arginine deiminase family protein [Flaviflexus massiliensis]
MTLTHVLVRRPSPKLANGLLTHRARTEVDADLALRQWEDYCAILADWAEVIEVEPAPNQADSVFVEDMAVVYKDTAIIANPRYPSREPETVAVRKALEDLGLTIKKLANWGYLEGGDIIKRDGKIWTGLSTRTDLDGVDWLKRGLADYEPQIVTVPVQHALHLKNVVTALPDGTFLSHPKYGPPESYFPGYRRAIEREGTQALILNETTLLMSQAAPETVKQLEADGFTVVTTAMTEFEKTEGGVTGLSLRIRK